MRFLLVTLFSFASLFGQTEHLITVGPKWSYLWRDKESGSKQKGSLWGLQGSYGRFKRYGWYLCANASYVAGILRGKVSDQVPIRSRYSDLVLEGQFGYTFCQKGGIGLGFTPFIGGGYIEERNNFTDPSPIPIHQKIDFGFLSTGFITWVRPLCCLEVGLEAKVRFPYEPTSHISNDPENDPTTQRIGERLFYRFDLPVAYRLSNCFHVALSPFAEFRYFGGRTNYPFDFIKTKETFLGCLIAIEWRI